MYYMLLAMTVIVIFHYKFRLDRLPEIQTEFDSIIRSCPDRSGSDDSDCLNVQTF